MGFAECFSRGGPLLLEGALGERLKREYGLLFDPEVAMAGLVYRPEGRRALGALWREYQSIARENGLPFLATTPTRRANRERVARSRFGAGILRDNLRFLRAVLAEEGGESYAGGLMGCRGDAYTGEGCLSAREAEAFHAWQAEGFREAGADFLYAGILPTLPEAVGLARAMAASGLPYLISFMLHGDGRLPDGTFLHDAIAAVDGAANPPPLGYLTNCVHPSVARRALTAPQNRTALVRGRFCGIQANASPLSPEELDGSEELHQSDAAELAAGMLGLGELVDLRVCGGCCGTDGSHLAAVARGLCELDWKNQ